METVSVITICFNNLAQLEQTCASVDGQTVTPTAHWIINGSSEPAIAQWLSQTPQPPYRKWINEKDNGISDAMNKGIQKATSSLIHLLHAGDEYASADILETVVKEFEKQPGVQWISGNIQMIRAGKPVVIGKPFDKTKLYRGMRSVSHPTWFVRREVYERIGLFSSGYKIAMDYDLMCRISDEPYAYLDKLIVAFDDTGVSTVNYLRSLAESRKVYESYFGFSYRLVAWQARLKILHHLLQTGVGKWLFGIKKKIGLENW